MKKFFSCVMLILVAFCSSCSVSVWNGTDGDKNVPTTIVNTTLSTSDEDLVTLYKNCVKSVVTVLNYASYYDKGKVVTNLYGSGSGFVYEYDDNYIYLYTNAHVVDVSTGYTQSHYEVVFYDGKRSYATLAYSDGSEDVAIMKVNRGNQDFAKSFLGNSESVSPGESVFALGSPLGLTYANTITQGIVSNTKVQMETDDDGDGNATTMYMIQVDAALNPGNSGGPLFNMKGEVIGVSTLKLMTDSSGDDVESFNFAIPINHFVVVANSLANNGTYFRPKLGVTVISITDMPLSDRDSYDITLDSGIYIESVSNTGASYGILSSKTVITKINDTVIKDLADFSIELYKYKAGDSIKIVTCDVDGSDSSSHTVILK